ncbi:MAG: NADH-quinone oxidoreductase subunit NuoN [Anaerolineales bacterium]|nr:NADH-quinone oxidoreductase subunit NuoN [Anaerolineales bacterium]
MDVRELTAILPFLIVVIWACVLLLVDLFIPRDRKGVTAVLAAVGLIAGLVAAVLQLGTEREAFGGMIIVDGYASILQILFMGTGLIAIMLAYDYVKRKGIERGEYYALLLFTLSGMTLMATAGDLIVVFLALELISLPLYVLAGFARPDLQSEESAIKYFLLGAFASSFVVYGIAMIFGATMTTSLAGIVAAIEAPPALMLVGGGLILVGLGFKVAAVPFHMWTPDVYHGAPSAVTAFMSVGAKAGGFAALLRVFVAAFPDLASSWGQIAMWIAALTMAWGNVVAIAQTNIKRMLAYSSIAHAGYILVALPAAASPQVAPEAIRAALFYLLGYAITNLGAWAVVLALERAEGKGLAIDDYAGLGSRRPALALAMALFMLSLTGMPPTVGFVGKFYIFRAAIDAQLVWLALVGVITSLISAYYYLRVIVTMYMRPGEPQTHSELWLNATVLLTAVGTFVFGILPGPLLALAGQAGLLSLLP